MTMDGFCKEAKIKKSLREKLKSAISYNSEKSFYSWVDKQQVFSELPPNLKCDIALHMHSGVVRQI